MRTRLLDGNLGEVKTISDGRLLPVARRAWLVAVCATCALILVWGLGLRLSPERQAVALALGVAVFGLPHGAYDFEVARRQLQPRLGPRWLPIFLLGYLGLGGGGLACLLVAPLATGAIFALISIFHFGAEDRAPLRPGWRGTIEALAHGSVPVVVPLLVQPGRVTAVTSLWVAEQGPALLALSRAPWLWAAEMGLIAAGLALALIPQQLERQRGGRRWSDLPPRQRPQAAVELVLLVAAAASLPPLVSFLLYFCLWHAGRSTARRLTALRSSDSVGYWGAAARFIGVAGPLSALAAAAAWALSSSVNGAPQLAATLQRAVFGALLALTFPHLALALLAGRRPTPASPRHLVAAAHFVAAPQLTLQTPSSS